MLYRTWIPHLRTRKKAWSMIPLVTMLNKYLEASIQNHSNRIHRQLCLIINSALLLKMQVFMLLESLLSLDYSQSGLGYSQSRGTSGPHTKPILMHPTNNGRWKVFRHIRPDGRVWFSIDSFLLYILSWYYPFPFYMKDFPWFWYFFDVSVISPYLANKRKWLIPEYVKLEYGVITCLCD